MTPLATIFLGVLITHDAFDARMIGGAAVALLGVLVVALRREHLVGPLTHLRSWAS
jgi:O-acetylserine/cysteine efflux transporter